MSSLRKSIVRRHFLLTSALAIPGFFGYGGRQAYAACSATGSSTYLCSGTLTTTQTITADNASVSMAPGAGIDTTGGTGNAITITGNGALSFTNTAGRAFRGKNTAIDITSTGDDGGTGGAITLRSTLGISADNGYGISAVNSDGATGSITISTAGVSSAKTDAIYARNRTATGRDLTITTTGAVSGQGNGLLARNDGTGALTITTASVTGGSKNGISARNEGTDLTVRASGTVTVSGAGSAVGERAAVYARNFGSGALRLETLDVVASGGSNVNGIFAQNASGTDLTITATGSVTGAGAGISAKNKGSGALTITAAEVHGLSDDGINAVINAGTGTDLTITTTGAVSGEQRGIYAGNGGTGSLTITAAQVTGSKNSGISAGSLDTTTDMTITATGSVSGAFSGVYASHEGSGDLVISVKDVEAFDGVRDHQLMRHQAQGIYASNHGANLILTSTGTVKGTKNGVATNNLATGSTTINVVNATGTYGGGISAASGYVSKDLTVTSTGTVSGGHFGIGAWNRGSGTLTINANNATGTTDAGIFAFTVTANTDITVTGAVYGGGQGIDMRAAGPNTITITETGSVSGGEYAIKTSVGAIGSDDTVVNHGTVTGNVDLGNGSNAFTNMVGGLFNTGATVNLGAGNTLTNRGDLSPGGAGTIQTTALTGNLVQDSGATFYVDMNSEAATADRVDISGTATLSGKVWVNPLNLRSPTEGLTIFSAAGGVIDNGLNAQDTVVIDYTLTFPNATDVVLGHADIDFTPQNSDGTSNLRTQNERNVGANMNAIYAAGGGGIHDLQLELMRIESIEAYQKALDRLHGEHYLVQAGATVGSLHGFRETLLSCPSRLDGIAVAAADDHCLWGRFQGRRTDIRQTTTTIGGGETSSGFSGGYEIPLEDGMRAGIAGSVETSDLGTDNSGSSDGMRYTVGAKFEKAWGALEAGFGAYGGLARYDTDRQVGLGMGTARSDQTISYGGIVSRLSYAFDTGTFRIVPMVDVAASRVSFGDIQETGAGSANLTISGNHDWILTATPALGVMGTLLERPGYKFNGSMKAGVSFHSNNEYSFTSHFTDAPSGAPGFTTSTKLDDTVVNLAAALELETAGGTSFKLGYSGGLGNVSHSNGGYVRTIVPF